jgi:hypothetical protein
VGGFGDDIVVSGPGHDDLYGGGMRDLLQASYGVGGNDSLNGGVDVDRCRSDSGDARFRCP